MSKIKLSILGSLLMAMVLVNTYLTYNKVQENNNLKVRISDLTLRCDSLVKQLNVKLDIIESNAKADSVIKAVVIKKEPVIIKKDSTVIVKKTEVIKKTNDLYNIVYCDSIIIKNQDLGIFNTTIFKTAKGGYLRILSMDIHPNGNFEMICDNVMANKKKVDYVDKMPVFIIKNHGIYKLSDEYIIEDIMVGENQSFRYKTKLTFRYTKEAN